MDTLRLQDRLIVMPLLSIRGLTRSTARSSISRAPTLWWSVLNSWPEENIDMDFMRVDIAIKVAHMLDKIASLSLSLSRLPSLRKYSRSDSARLS